MMIENSVPLLNVRDLEESAAFYTAALGFQVVWEVDVDGDRVAGMSRDGTSIMLCQGSQGVPGSWLWIGVEEASIFTQILASGATVVQEPTNYPWAYELRVADPDGNVIRVGTGPLEEA